MMAILINVMWYLTEVLISISLILSNFEHLFMCLFPSIFSLWRSVCLDILSIFLLDCLLFWYWDTWVTCLFWRLILCHLLHWSWQNVFCAYFALNFIVSGFTIRYLIYFQFIFLYGVMNCSNFIPLRVAVQFSQHHLLKRLFFLYCVFLTPLSKIRYP